MIFIQIYSFLSWIKTGPVNVSKRRAMRKSCHTLFIIIWFETPNYFKIHIHPMSREKIEIEKKCMLDFQWKYLLQSPLSRKSDLKKVCLQYQLFIIIAFGNVSLRFQSHNVRWRTRVYCNGLWNGKESRNMEPNWSH